MAKAVLRAIVLPVETIHSVRLEIAALKLNVLQRAAKFLNAHPLPLVKTKICVRRAV